MNEILKKQSESLKPTIIFAKTVSEHNWGALTTIKWPSQSSFIPLIDMKGLNF